MHGRRERGAGREPGVELAARGEDEAQKQGRRPPRPRFELGVELGRDVKRVVGSGSELHDLHARPGLVLADKAQPRSFQRGDERRVDLVPVPVAFVDVALGLGGVGVGRG